MDERGAEARFHITGFQTLDDAGLLFNGICTANSKVAVTETQNETKLSNMYTKT